MADSPIRVLVIDDDPTLREMYIARLLAEKYAVDQAADGQQGLARAVEQVPDVILLDMRMPNVSGLEALEILKTTQKTKNVPVIVLTALGDDTLRQQAMARGAADYMVKAETMPAQVVDKIKEVLG